MVRGGGIAPPRLLSESTYLHNLLFSLVGVDLFPRSKAKPHQTFDKIEFTILAIACSIITSLTKNIPIIIAEIEESIPIENSTKVSI